jgi:DNA-binding NtrC family response regulator
MQPEPHKILLVMDDPRRASALAEFIDPSGLDVLMFDTLGEVRNFESLDRTAILVLDVGTRVDVLAPQLSDLTCKLPHALVLALLAKGMERNEELLRHAGVQEFLPRGLPLHHLARILVRFSEIRRLEEQNQRHRAMQESRTSYENLIGGSLAMRGLYRLIEQVARADAPVLITGESGSEFLDVARSIHGRSERRREPFVLVDCSQTTRGKLEQQVFGPVGGGSYPQGPSPDNSAFARAGKGTLVLHHIEESDAAVQKRLINFFQQPYFQGETLATPQPIARIVATAANDIERRVESGTFNRELYFRLNILRARVPPLRDRREDIPLLAEHFLRCLAPENGTKKPRGPLSLSGEALMQFFRYPWPGNLEELEASVHEAANKTRTQQINREDLPEALLKFGEPEEGSAHPVSGCVPMKQAKRNFEADYFKSLLQHTRGNMTMASRISKVGRPYLYKKLKEHEIEPEEFR